MTAREYFTRHAVDGRAVLAGSIKNPRFWLADVDHHLVLCRATVDGITFIADDAPMPERPFVTPAQFPRCRCWFCVSYDVPAVRRRLAA